VVDGDEQVAFAHRSLAQHGEDRRIALDRNHVGQAAHFGKQLLIAVDDGDVVAVSAEHPRQMAAHLARTRYHDFHRYNIIGLRSIRPVPNVRATFLQFILQMYTFVPETPNFGH